MNDRHVQMSRQSRAAQHLSHAQDTAKESHMRRHIEESHPGGSPATVFNIKQITPHVSALTRQVEEAFLIKKFRGGTLLNTKYEYNHGILPSLTTTDPRSTRSPAQSEKLQTT